MSRFGCIGVVILAMWSGCSLAPMSEGRLDGGFSAGSTGTSSGGASTSTGITGSSGGTSSGSLTSGGSTGTGGSTNGGSASSSGNSTGGTTNGGPTTGGGGTTGGRPSCGSDADCVPGTFCDAKYCEPQQPNGVPCSSADRCTSGNCISGVCCNSACGPCGSCYNGTCEVVPAGDPHQQIPCAPYVCNGTSVSCPSS